MRNNKVITYDDNGKNIYISDEDKLNSLYINTLPSDTLIIKIINSFHPSFIKFINILELVNVIQEYVKHYGEFRNVLIDFNEITVNPNGVQELENLINKPCYYMNFDIDVFSNEKHITYPHSMYTHLNYLIEDDFLNAQTFLKNTILNYKRVLKPHKFVFFSNNINIVRINIFNLLKETNNLNDNIWSFNTKEQYYSNYGVDLPLFLKNNEELIPHSYDKFYDLNTDLSNLKVSFLPNYLSYFEILTDSFYFTQIIDIKNHTPCTEKIFKPIIGYQPFIVFASPKLKSTLEKIGMTFNSNLYGFYDITSSSSIKLGLTQINEQINKTKEELHKEYFENIEEYFNNCDVFLNFLLTNKQNMITKLS